MNNPYATTEQTYVVSAIAAAVKATRAKGDPETRDLWVYEENTVLNIIDTFWNKKENNPISSKKHSDHVYRLVIDVFWTREQMRYEQKRG